MMMEDKQIIEAAYTDGGLLDALLALQKAEGYVSEAALTALADYLGVSVGELYDTASFYSMLRFEKGAAVDIRVCRGTACHSGGNRALMAALEEATGAKPGQASPDGRFALNWVECLGQCQAAPNLLINGTLYTNVDPAKISELLGGLK